MERSIGALSVAALLLTMMSPVARGLTKHDRGLGRGSHERRASNRLCPAREDAIVGPIARGPRDGVRFSTVTASRCDAAI